MHSRTGIDKVLVVWSKAKREEESLVQHCSKRFAFSFGGADTSNGNTSNSGAGREAAPMKRMELCTRVSSPKKYRR